MRKRKLISDQQVQNESRSFSSFIFFALAAICFILLTRFAYQYTKENDKLNQLREDVNVQISIIEELRIYYARLLRGQVGLIETIENYVTNFDTILKKQSQALMLHTNSKQKTIFHDITKRWQSQRSYFTEVSDAKTTIKSVKKLVDDISSLASNIKLSASTLEDIIGDEVVLEPLINTVSIIDNSTSRILSGGNQASIVGEQLSSQTERFLSAISKFANSLSGDTDLFASAANIGKTKKLHNQLGQFSSYLGELSSNLPQFIHVSGPANAIEKNNMEIISSLRALKETYVFEQQPIYGLSISYILLFFILITFGLIFLIIGIIIVWKHWHNLNAHATLLKLEAENRSENDQRAILRLMDELEELSSGDLTVQAKVTEDVTGAIADSVNMTIESMRGMVGTITHTSAEIARSADNSQHVASLLSESSKEQSHQINTSTNTMSKIANSLHNISAHTDASAEIARSSVDIAKDGRNRVQSTIKSMTDIRENIQDTAKRIKRLGESSQEIGDIIEIIKSIADQTNVLALNAAIQATAAGEAGRGFAVVADEVQQLAERSANATKRIEVLVKTIQADANEAISSMESSTTQVVSGASIAEEAGQSLDKIEDVSSKLANLIVDASKATKNAAGLANEITDNMGDLSKLNQKTVSDVTTSVRSINNLKTLSVSLKKSVSGFKLAE